MFTKSPRDVVVDDDLYIFYRARESTLPYILNPNYNF